jgi:DNA-binding transcriptional MerR regulator
MYIQEAAKLSGTTKKAIEYYCLKGLLNPRCTESGYRDFSEEDVICLKKISLLRSLGVSVEEIRELLNGNDSTVFQRIIKERENVLQRRKEQIEL